MEEPGRQDSRDVVPSLDIHSAGGCSWEFGIDILDHDQGAVEVGLSMGNLDHCLLERRR